MKKALVLSLVLAIGLGFAVMAQTWEGTWDTDIVIVPAAATFANFISSFDSDLDVNFLVGGWDFGMTSDFSATGLDGLGFTAEGALGAFSFDVDIDFIPMKVSAVNTKYTGLGLSGAADSGVTCLVQTNSVIFTSVAVTQAVSPAFDDLTVEGNVSIAGVSFAGLFYLKGTDTNAPTVYSTYTSTNGVDQFEATGTAPGSLTYVANANTVASSTTVGSGMKFTLSGTLAGATITSYTYFNTYEKMYNTVMAAYGDVSTEDALKKYGTIAGLVCEGCNVAWSSQYILIEGMSFGFCATVDIAAEFTCCGFDHVAFLFKDIELGFGIDLDFLVKFTTSAKTMTLVPEIDLSGTCFTIITELQYSDQTIDGIQIEGLTASQVYNGLTISFAASWDYSDYPLIGTSSTITHHSGAKVYFFKPDLHNSDLIGDSVSEVSPAVEDDGDGDWVLDYASCYYEKATVYNKLSLDYEADACCGGLFELSSDTYFGTIATYTLTGIYGTYLYDEDGTDYTGIGDVDLDFLGSLLAWELAYDADGVLNKIDVADDHEVWSADAAADECDPCPAPDTHAVEYLLIDKEYAVGTENSIFGWVESDIDLSVGVATNVTLDLGVDIAWWGWESLSFGFTFEW